jgi:hypothetical protein
MVPEIVIIEAEDLGKAQTEALRISKRNEAIEEEDFGTKLLSVEEELLFEPVPDPPDAA